MRITQGRLPKFYDDRDIPPRGRYALSPVLQPEGAFRPFAGGVARARRWGRAWSIARISGLEIAVLAALAANLLCMEAWPGWESLPPPEFRGAHVRLLRRGVGAVAPCHRHRDSRAAATAAIRVAERGHRSGAERTETALLTTMIVATIWRAEGRQRARRTFAGFSHEPLSAMTVIRGHVDLLDRRRPASTASTGLRTIDPGGRDHPARSDASNPARIGRWKARGACAHGCGPVREGLHPRGVVTAP